MCWEVDPAVKLAALSSAPSSHLSRLAQAFSIISRACCSLRTHGIGVLYGGMRL